MFGSEYASARPGQSAKEKGNSEGGVSQNQLGQRRFSLPQENRMHNDCGLKAVIPSYKVANRAGENGVQVTCITVSRKNKLFPMFTNVKF